jgi:hypothetical protein
MRVLRVRVSSFYASRITLYDLRSTFYVLDIGFNGLLEFGLFFAWE